MGKSSPKVLIPSRHEQTIKRAKLISKSKQMKTRLVHCNQNGKTKQEGKAISKIKNRIMSSGILLSDHWLTDCWQNKIKHSDKELNEKQACIYNLRDKRENNEDQV